MAATDIIFSGLYYAVGSQVQVTIGGLYCGSFTVVSPGTVTVPINSDPDALCNGKYLQTLDVGPWDKTTYGALTTALTIDIAGLGQSTIYVPVAIGFTYPSMGQVMRPASPEVTKMSQGSAAGALRRVHTAAILGTFIGGNMGLQAGTNFARMNAANVRTKGGTPLLHTQTFQGVHFMAVSDDDSMDGQICWQMLNPYPCIINSINSFISFEPRSG